MRYTRPPSPASDTRLRPNFLRITPARKPRTECCCHPVAVIIAAIVVPDGARSISITCACLLSVRWARARGCSDGRCRRTREICCAALREVELAALLRTIVFLVLELDV